MLKRALLCMGCVAIVGALLWELLGLILSPDGGLGLARFWLIVATVLGALASASAISGQLHFFLRRIAQFPLILAIIYLITFLFVWVAPGDPFNNSERIMSENARNSLREKFHAEHWYTFLAYYPRNIILHGDFGPSMSNAMYTVNETIADKLPISVKIGTFAMVIAVLVGVSVGTLAAVRRNGVLDWTSLGMAVFGISLPSFVAASALILLFAVWLKVFPPDWANGSFVGLILPSVSLSLLPMAYITRLTRVSMIDVLGSDYVRTARAKGLSKPRVIWKHCLRNALLPVISYIGPAAATTLVGSFVVETLFNIPGLGQYFVTSVQNRDQTLIIGTVLVESALVLALNLVVEISYAFVDPRIDVGGKRS